uniref:SHR-BD domain-containing protein n=1 Tax=Macrostomum lignano TaxID=282301 RepID=A0A1I8FM48_9PLAT
RAATIRKHRYAEFSPSLAVTISRQRHAKTQLLWIHSSPLSTVTDERGFHPNRQAKFPSKCHEYLVSSKTPYCREYFIPLPPPPPPPRPGTVDTADASAGASTASQCARVAASAPAVADNAKSCCFDLGDTNPSTASKAAGSSRAHPARPPHNMANLLETFMHNRRSACNEHWVRAVALDMGAIRGVVQRDDLRWVNRQVRVSSPVSAASWACCQRPRPSRYQSWRRAGSRATISELFERPDLIFAVSVVPFKSGGSSIGWQAGRTGLFGIRCRCFNHRVHRSACVSNEEIGPAEPPPVTMFQAVTMGPDSFKVAVTLSLALDLRRQHLQQYLWLTVQTCSLANNTCYLLEAAATLVVASNGSAAPKELSRSLTSRWWAFGASRRRFGLPSKRLAIAVWSASC